MAGSHDVLPTGYEPIDAMHASIGQAVECFLAEVNRGSATGARGALAVLLMRTTDHFAHEERLMAETGYSQRARHKEAHDLFLGDVTTFLHEVNAKGITPGFRRWAVGRLQTWIRFHVSVSDVALGAFLAARHRQGRAPSHAELADAARARELARAR